MLRLNKKVEYGVIALLYLSGQEGKTASVREMANASGISETLLSKIMQTMKNVGFVNAVYGNQGGYRLTRDLSQINLLELTQTLTGPLLLADCLEPGGKTCPVKNSCTIVSPLNVLNQKIMSLFQETSVEALAVRKTAV